MIYNVEPETEIGELHQHDEGELAAQVLVDLGIRWSRLNDEGEEVEGSGPFDLRIQVAGVFSWPEATKPDLRLAELWLEYNGMYLLWPYARAYVATISGMSLHPPLTLYTMNVPKPPELAETEEGAETESEAVARAEETAAPGSPP